MANEYNHFEGVVIQGNDPRMRFRNSQDPIYVAYEFVDSSPCRNLLNRSLKTKLTA